MTVLILLYDDWIVVSVHICIDNLILCSFISVSLSLTHIYQLNKTSQVKEKPDEPNMDFLWPVFA